MKMFPVYSFPMELLASKNIVKCCIVGRNYLKNELCCISDSNLKLDNKHEQIS